MKNSTSRRNFMRNTAMALTGLAVITPTITSALTTSEGPFEGYNPFAETKKDLRTSVFNTNSVLVKGTIYEQDGITPVKDALVEISKYRHRAKLYTDSNGNYEFITDFPNREKGKSSRIYYKLSNNNKTQFTELILTSTGGYITGEHWEKNSCLKENILPVQTHFLDQKIIQFNISI